LHTTAPATSLQFSEAESASQAGHCDNICNHKFTILAGLGLWSILGDTQNKHSKTQRRKEKIE
jgi:hypothetical protein